MNLRQFYCARWRESFSDYNLFYWFLSKEAKGPPDDPDDGLHFAIGCLSVLYWATLPVWVWSYVLAEWRCMRQGHMWDVGGDDPPIYARCVNCEIEHRKELTLDI